MATPTINLELLQHFSPILVLILVFAIIYGVMQWAKILGDNKVLHSIIAFIIAIFVSIFSESARIVITTLIPWLTVLAIFIVFAIMLYKIFGATDDDVKNVIMERADVQWTLFILIIILFLGALSQAFGQKQLSYTIGDQNTTTDFTPGHPGTTNTASGNFNQNLGATIYHPKVLGTIFLFIMGALTIAFLSRPVKI